MISQDGKETMNKWQKYKGPLKERDKTKLTKQILLPAPLNQKGPRGQSLLENNNKRGKKEK